MAKNNTLTPATLPMEQKWNKKPETRFLNNLDAMKVELIQYPSVDQLLYSLPQFCNATWNDNCLDALNKMTLQEKYQCVYDAFHFKYLPQSLETVGLTFRLENIDMQTVTHILRYRRFTFSAECSGDKWWTDKDALVPNSIENSDEFYERYKKIVEDSKQLYCDMIDSKKVSIMDARHILPRCLSTYYLCHCNFLDLLNMLKQRIDKQIQPEEDNLLAYKMYNELIKKIPFAINSINIHSPAMHYVKMARTGKATNLYYPDKDSDIFEWNEKDFIYQNYRNELNGTNENSTNKFDRLFAKYDKEISDNTEKAKEFLNSSCGGELKY